MNWLNPNLNNPWLNLGIGLLSQPTMGQGLQAGLLNAQNAHQAGLREQFMQQETQSRALQDKMLQAQLAEHIRKQQLMKQFGGLLGGNAPPALLQRPDLPEFKQGQMMGILGELDPGAAMGLLNPKSDLQGKLKEFMDAKSLGQLPGTMTFEQYLTLNKQPQTVVNVGDNKIIGSDAPSWMNAAGQNPSPTATIAEATAQGFRPFSTDQLKSRQAGIESAPVVSNLTSLAFGEGDQGSIFPADNASLMDRLKSRAETSYGVSTQSPSYSRQLLYSRTKQAFVTQLARLSGQVGTLTDRDVDLVAGMLPTEGYTPESTAREQFRQIANFLMSKGMSEEQLQGLGMPKWVFRKPLSEIDR